MKLMKIFNGNVWNILYLIILGIISLFTREIVTFVMLGFILLSLTNIYMILKEISKKLDHKEH